MKKLAYVLVIAVIAVFIAGPAMAEPATKFAASWDDDVVWVNAAISYPGPGACTGSPGFGGSGTAGDPCVLAEELLATIDVAQQKDLLIGVSGQIGLVTITQAKGKSDVAPTMGEALASAGVAVTLELRDPETGGVIQTAAPGPVIFAARLQEIKVGVTSSEDYDEVLVYLKLNTTAAHHFNFLGVDLDQGLYDVVAVFNLSAFVAIVGEDAMAEAEVILGPRMVTVQEVRAAKGQLVPLGVP